MIDAGSAAKVGRIKPDRDRPVIDEFDGHFRSEATGLYGDTQSAQRCSHAFDKRGGVLWIRCANETWPPPFADVAIQGELRHNEDPDLCRVIGHEVERRTIQVTVCIVKDAKIGDLRGEEYGI